MALTVLLHQAGMKAQEVAVEDVESASKAVTDWQDRNGFGASDVGEKHGRLYDGDDYRGYVAYNGRFFASHVGNGKFWA